MNIYRISRKDFKPFPFRNMYDVFDSAVVAAKDEESARKIHPGLGGLDSWVKSKEVKVELIGEAIKGTKAGVIVSSFNAG
jgi:hypothetical protein